MTSRHVQVNDQAKRQQGDEAMWPTDMVELLRRCVAAGYSGGQTTSTINRDGRWPHLPKTRNAIIGKIHRLAIGDTKPLRESATAAKLKARSMIWTPQLDKHIQELYAAGSTLGAIAEATNAGFHLTAPMTYPMIRGRLKDLGVYTPKKINAKTKGAAFGYRQPGAPKAPMLVCIIEAEPETSVHSHKTDRSMCQWPTSDCARDMHVCGQKAVQGSYCARHAEIAYRQPPTPRRAALFHRRNQYD